MKSEILSAGKGRKRDKQKGKGIQSEEGRLSKYRADRGERERGGGGGGGGREGGRKNENWL